MKSQAIVAYGPSRNETPLQRWPGPYSQVIGSTVLPLTNTMKCR